MTSLVSVTTFRRQYLLGNLPRLSSLKGDLVFQKRPRVRSRELNIEQSYFSPWENHGVSPLGAHFCTQEGE